RVEIHGAWNGQLPDADVLKMDCDGCEEILTKKHLDPYRQWAVAIHLEPWLAWEHFKRLRIMLQAAGARLHWQTPDGKEQVYLKA
nr:hypothetical protein [Anaerolineae bacterium]NIN98446.1 hypothetical protein [Anaerolineae bacterium]